MMTFKEFVTEQIKPKVQEEKNETKIVEKIEDKQVEVKPEENIEE